MLNAGIVGVRGYTGEELLYILLRHPRVQVAGLYATNELPKHIAQIFPKVKGKLNLICKKPDLNEIDKNCELVFLALPHTASMDLVPQLLRMGKRVVDLSADYRLKDIKAYEKFYHVPQKDKAGLSKAVYGLPELYRAKIKSAKLIANPGCYPTVSILALAPLVAFSLIDPDSVIIDAKSGFSGAGKKMVESTLLSETKDDFKAYKVNVHQHSPEIDQELTNLAGKKFKVTFVPHLLPIYRGILVTVYAKKAASAKAKDLTALYKKFYKGEPFVRVRNEGDYPRIKDVANTNFCDIAIKDEADKVIVIAAIDNLLKGASGQAVQNMNIMYGFPEKTALI